MARKQPIGYEVRRPLTLWGKRREIGEYLPKEEVASLIRVESFVRSGRFLAVYDETDLGYVARGQRGTRKEVINGPKVEKPVEAEKPADKPKRGRPVKKVAEEEK